MNPLIKPTERQRVYDLVQEAGLDVSDWSNYKLSDSPAKNPNYCYEWSFIAADKVVVCLWFGEMQEDSEGIFQLLDYRERPIQRPDLSAVHKQRCWKMDRAFRTAFKQKLPLRVIIVDGPVDAVGDSSVQNRSLDTEFWHVAAYDEETGTCRIQRGLNTNDEAESSNSNAIDDLGFDPDLYTQIRGRTVVFDSRDQVWRATIAPERIACPAFPADAQAVDAIRAA